MMSLGSLLIQWFSSLLFWDWVLVLCVALFGTMASLVRDAQIKAVFATLPVPFALAWLAVGRTIDITNAVSMFAVLLYAHGVRLFHDRWHWPILLSISMGVFLYSVTGAGFAHGLVHSEWAFLGVCALGMVLGLWILRHQHYDGGTPYRTPLHPVVKFLAVFGVVFGLVFLKSFLAGFTTFFPMMNTVTSYEMRRSLATQTRQIPVFLVAAGPMLVSMRYLEIGLHTSRWVTLGTGIFLYMMVFLPLNAWVRRQSMTA